MEINIPSQYLPVLLKIGSLFKLEVSLSLSASILAGFILLTKFAIKNKFSAKWHYYIWFLVIIKLTVPYSIQSPLSVFNIINIPQTNIEQSYSSTYGADEKTAAVSTAFSTSIENQGMEASNYSISNSAIEKNTILKGIAFFWAVLSLLWLAGIFIILFLSIRSTLNYWIMVKKQPVCHDSQILDLLSDCRKTLNIKCNVQIVYSSDINTPTLFQIIKPTILLPANIIKHLDTSELRYIFLHELVHLKRRDTKAGFLLSLVNIIHWFNPCIWYCLSVMRQDSELLCDALVLSHINEEDRKKYGLLIIKLLEGFAKTVHVCGTEGFILDKVMIKRRITMISIFNKGQIKWSIISVASLVAIGSLFLTNSRIDHKTLPNSYTTVAASENSVLNTSNEPADSNSIKTTYITGKNFDGILMVVQNPRKISTGYSDKLPATGETTSNMAQKNNAMAAINGGGFYDENFKGTGGKPYGLILHDGKVIFNEAGNESAKQKAVGFDDKGTLIAGNYSLADLKKMNIKEAVSSEPVLIFNGKPQISDEGGMGVAPRSAVGQKSDGTVLFLAINGRSAKSIGATVKDVQDILMEQGAVTAALLDGGSSTTMVYQGKVINTPCGTSVNQSDETYTNVERSVASAFIVNK